MKPRTITLPEGSFAALVAGINTIDEAAIEREVEIIARAAKLKSIKCRAATKAK